MDLGRPERFYNMLRIFKPRSPMSMGAWALSAFGGLAAAAVGADLLGRRREAKLLGGANAIVGGYLGSYTGVLLASTAVPVWAPLAAVPRPDLRLHGDRDRRGGHAAGARRHRPAGRAPDAATRSARSRRPR